MAHYHVVTGESADLGIYEATNKEDVIAQVLKLYPNFRHWSHTEQLAAVTEVK